jgi:hypothetical protein
LTLSVGCYIIKVELGSSPPGRKEATVDSAKEEALVKALIGDPRIVDRVLEALRLIRSQPKKFKTGDVMMGLRYTILQHYDFSLDVAWYIREAETQDGIGYWQDFGSKQAIYDDIDLYLENLGSDDRPGPPRRSMKAYKIEIHHFRRPEFHYGFVGSISIWRKTKEPFISRKKPKIRHRLYLFKDKAYMLRRFRQLTQIAKREGYKPEPCDYAIQVKDKYVNFRWRLRAVR